MWKATITDNVSLAPGSAGPDQQFIRQRFWNLIWVPETWDRPLQEFRTFLPFLFQCRAKLTILGTALVFKFLLINHSVGVCGHGYYSCKTTGRCINMGSVCNRPTSFYDQCPDYYDRLGCGKVLNKNKKGRNGKQLNISCNILAVNRFDFQPDLVKFMMVNCRFDFKTH